MRFIYSDVNKDQTATGYWDEIDIDVSTIRSPGFVEKFTEAVAGRFATVDPRSAHAARFKDEGSLTFVVGSAYRDGDPAALLSGLRFVTVAPMHLVPPVVGVSGFGEQA